MEVDALIGSLQKKGYYVNKGKGKGKGGRHFGGGYSKRKGKGGPHFGGGNFKRKGKKGKGSNFKGNFNYGYAKGKAKGALLQKVRKVVLV